jgi:hypothetical protein
MDSMENAYSFVDDCQSFPNKIKSWEKVIKAILRQTLECALFIQEYTQQGFASKSCLIGQ